jgi:hypothetical protein
MTGTLIGLVRSLTGPEGCSKLRLSSKVEGHTVPHLG